MKAAVFHEAHQPLALEEVPRPRPGEGEVLVRVAACGVCHTDLHYVDHGVKTFMAPPLILGHEAAGIIAELGPNARGRKVGERVLLPAVRAASDDTLIIADGFSCFHQIQQLTGRRALHIAEVLQMAIRAKI